jgi:proline iminopeptidase
MRSLICLAFSILLFSACQLQTANTTTDSSPTVKDYFNYGDTNSVQDGGVKMITIDGKYKVWTKQIGNGKIKVLLLHGGPAMTHEYWECAESYFPKAGIEFIEYDQLGSYYSDQPADTTLWRLPRFVEEVEQVRKALGIDSFYLLGHSWGGILAMEYAHKYQQHLKGLIISNMVASMDSYLVYNGKLRAMMNADTLAMLKSYEDKGDYNNPKYYASVIHNYYDQHILRMDPWPEPVKRTFEHLNSEIYVQMQGPSEFKTGGNLMGWDFWDKLKDLSIPTLCIGGHYDTMDPNQMKEMSERVQNGRFLYCPNGAHMDMWDDQKIYFAGVIKFLNDVNNGTFKKG